MAPARAAAYLGGTTLLLAWLASAAGVSRQPQGAVTGRAAAGGVQLDALTSDVQSQAVRLRTRLAAAPAPQAPLRNPFAFSTQASSVTRRAPTHESLPVATAPLAVEPVIELVGVAEQATEGGVRRTAMLSAPGDQLFMVTEGQEVDGRYRVSAVGADAVELKDLVTGATRRLGLR